jgi:hypothetical protein
MAMVPVKELGLQVKVTSLQQVFMTLASSLHPMVIHTSDGQETLDIKLEPAVRTSIETALVQTCNRICDFMGDDRNWIEDDTARQLLGNLMAQAVEENQKKSARKPRTKKGPTDEQK